MGIYENSVSVGIGVFGDIVKSGVRVEPDLGGAPADQSVLDAPFISDNEGSVRERDSSNHLTQTFGFWSQQRF